MEEEEKEEALGKMKKEKEKKKKKTRLNTKQKARRKGVLKNPRIESTHPIFGRATATNLDLTTLLRMDNDKGH